MSLGGPFYVAPRVIINTFCSLAYRSGVTVSVTAPIHDAWLGGLSVAHINFMPITQGLEKSVQDDVEYLKKSPYVKKDATISAWIYDTLHGTIHEVQM